MARLGIVELIGIMGKVPDRSYENIIILNLGAVRTHLTTVHAVNTFDNIAIQIWRELNRKLTCRVTYT